MKFDYEVALDFEKDFNMLIQKYIDIDVIHVHNDIPYLAKIDAILIERGINIGRFKQRMNLFYRVQDKNGDKDIPSSYGLSL